MKRFIAGIIILGVIIGALIITLNYHSGSTGRSDYSPGNINSQISDNAGTEKTEQIDNERKGQNDDLNKTNPIFNDILGQSNRLTQAQKDSMLAWRKEIHLLASKNSKLLFLNGFTDKKTVSLSFDDGPDIKYTAEIIGILKEYGVKGNFFFNGYRVNQYPEVVKEAYAEGNLVLNHTQNHLSLDKKTAQVISKEILDSEEAIYKVIGKRPAIVRPPYGAVNNALLDEISKNHDIMVIWSIDTLDWSQKEAGNIANNVLDNVRPGDIVLMHSNEDREATVKALPLIIKGLQQKGYDIVGLDILLNVDAYK